MRPSYHHQQPALLQGTPRSRLAVMQTLEDYATASSDEDTSGSESMQGFVTGLSAAQQVPCQSL